MLPLAGSGPPPAPNRCQHPRLSRARARGDAVSHPAGQTDRGQEFFADEVQDDLRERQIKFRPNRPRAPHLNGKVERVQRTALEEFWPTVDVKGSELAAQLEQWRSFYNHHRPHSAGGGSTPAERIAELAPKIPTIATVKAAYDPSRAFIRSQNTRYRWVATATRVT